MGLGGGGQLLSFDMTQKILIKVGYFYLGSLERNLIQYLIRFLFMLNFASKYLKQRTWDLLK